LFKVGTVVSIAANGVVYFNFGGEHVPDIRVFADVATAEAASGSDDDICFVVSNWTFYRYESVAGGISDDNTYALSTAEGGNTRWVGVAGRYDLYKSCPNIGTVAEAEALVNQSLGDLLYVTETKTIYQYETTGAAYTDDNTYVLSTGAGGNTRWIGVAGKYLADPNSLWTIQQEPTGFPIDSATGEVDKASSTLSFVNGTRTFSITATGVTFDYYISGKKYSSALASTVIANTEGMHYIYFDTAGAIQNTTVFDTKIFTQYVFIATVYWDVSGVVHIYLGDERHGVKMDGHTHLLHHLTRGTQFISGCALNTLSVDQDGSANSHAQFGTDAGVIRDEDLSHTLSAILSTVGLPIYYKLGAAGDWVRELNAGYAFIVSGGSVLPYWNEWTGATWQTTEMANTRYVLYHIFATNDASNQYISVMGQAAYISKNAAETGANNEIANLITVGLPFAEFVPIASIIIQGNTAYTNAINSRIRSTSTGADYVDWRYAKISPSAISVMSHSNLSNLGNDDHRSVYQAKEGRTGDIVANATTGTIDDLANATYTGFVFNGAGAVTLTGLVAASDSKELAIINNTGNVLTVADEDAGSVAANRILTGTASDLSLIDGASIQLIYDETNSRWRILGGTGGTPGTPSGTPLAIRLAAMEIDGAVNAINTDRSLYTVAALSSVLAGSVTITNRNTTGVSVRVAHVPGAIGTVGADDYIYYNVSLLAKETQAIEIPGMAASDSILVRSDTVDVSFKLHGLFTATVENIQRIASHDIAVINTNETVISLVSNTANMKYYICNRNSASTATVQMALIDGAIGTLADEDWNLEDTFSPGEVKSYDLGEGLALGGTVAFRSDTLNVNILLYGEIY